MQAAATATVALKMIQSRPLEPAVSGARAGVDAGVGASATTSTLALAGVLLRRFERLDAIRTDSALGGWMRLLTAPTGIVEAVRRAATRCAAGSTIIEGTGQCATGAPAPGGQAGHCCHGIDRHLFVEGIDTPPIDAGIRFPVGRVVFRHQVGGLDDFLLGERRQHRSVARQVIVVKTYGLGERRVCRVLQLQWSGICTLATPSSV